MALLPGEPEAACPVCIQFKLVLMGLPRTNHIGFEVSPPEIVGFNPEDQQPAVIEGEPQLAQIRGQ